MSEPDAFLDAIFAHPEDDTPRLVYADWLEEHGEEEYAQFIRVDCEIARRDVMPPAERKQLRDRRFALWRAVEKRWADQLAGLYLSHGCFSRGILHAQPTVDAVTFVTRSHQWWPLLPIRTLTIRNPDGFEKEVATCPYLSRLRWLVIGDSGWHDRLAPASPIREDMVLEMARSPLLDRIEALALGPVSASPRTLQALAAAPFMGRLSGDAFLLRLRHSADQFDDEFIRGHPGSSARETVENYLRESAQVIE